MLKKYLIIFFISMIPMIELRGAVPVALSPKDMTFFGCLQGMGLPVLPSYLVCILGNMIPVPIIFFFARRVLEWGADKPYIGKLFNFFLEKGHKGGQKLHEKAGRGLFVALLLFVGIPLPGTGAWTGSLVAAVLRMRIVQAFLIIMAGVLVSGFITGGIAYGLFTAFA